ncbi:MAG: phosphatidate cytidylyltransferase [Bacteroidia bacterium]
MSLYYMLAGFFAIGGIAVYKVCQGRAHAEKRKHWVKFVTYAILVFGQMLLISNHAYLWFSILIALAGFFEVAVLGKKPGIGPLLLYLILAAGFYCFFKTSEVGMQQFVFIIVITFDGYSQLAGQLAGRTKLFPTISPGKTWEGLAGGLISVVITSLLLSGAVHLGCLNAVVYGLLAGILAMLGDWIASFYKRYNGVKDFSRMIPGHGGVLDRFDGLIFACSGVWMLQFLPSQDAVLWNFIAYLLLFLGIFFCAELGYRSLKLKVEITRKFVHFFSGAVCLTFPLYLDSWTWVFALCLGFIIILALSRKYALLPSINAIERKSYGSIVFPVAVMACYLFFSQSHYYLYFYIPILILAICDPLAALSGKRWPYSGYRVGRDTKTLVGSCVFCASCFLVLLLSLSYLEAKCPVSLPLYCFGIAVVATFAEACSSKGLDNVTIPVSILLSMCLFGAF